MRIEPLASTWRCRTKPKPDLTGSVDAAEAASARSAEVVVRPGVRGSCAGWW